MIRDPYFNSEHIDYHRIKNYGPQFSTVYMDDFRINPDYGWHATPLPTWRQLTRHSERPAANPQWS